MELKKSKPRIAYISNHPDSIVEFSHLFREHFEINYFQNIFQFIYWASRNEPLKLIVTHSDLLDVNGINLRQNCKQIPNTQFVPFIAIFDRISFSNRSIAFSEHYADIFERPINSEEFLTRAKYLIENPPYFTNRNKLNDFNLTHYRMPISKRIFDITVAAFALLILSPFFLIIAILIKLESRGPVFYASKRVGTGYAIFDFYKFRSMLKDADALLEEIKHLNQYTSQLEGNTETIKMEDYRNYLCDDCKAKQTSCRKKLYMDGDMICENIYADVKKLKEGPKFIKIENDPRITRFGKFIRNTSIDELPQLFNVLKGDMSLVGNRPLPLYEAEKLTTDYFVLRFLAPAGITGLWQVTERGKGGPMSQEERMNLDNEYAKQNSFWSDIKLILRTIPALFQKENV
jgi:lipopolysaccharide/colanic/teichoic acid biosynthesis glycosyltransferase